MKTILSLIALAFLSGCAGISASKYHSVTEYSGVNDDGVPIPTRQEVNHVLRLGADSEAEGLAVTFESYNETASLSADSVKRNASEPIKAKGEADERRINATGGIVEDVIPAIVTP